MHIDSTNVVWSKWEQLSICLFSCSWYKGPHNKDIVPFVKEIPGLSEPDCLKYLLSDTDFSIIKEAAKFCAAWFRTQVNSFNIALVLISFFINHTTITMNL